MDQEDQIVDFLDGNLDSDGIREVEARIASDPEFAAEVATYRQVYADMPAFGDFQRGKSEVDSVAAEVESEIANENARTSEDPKVRPLRSNSRKWLTIAASVIVLAVVTYSLLPNYDKGFYLENYPGLVENPGNLRGNDIDYTGYILALDAYERKSFPLVIKVLSAQPTNSAKKVLLGSAYLQIGDAPAAIQMLETVGTDATYYEYARWLLALAHLHLGQEDQATKYLQQMVADPARRYKKSEAEAILRQLGRFWR